MLRKKNLLKFIYLSIIANFLIIFVPINVLASTPLFIGILENFNNKQWSSEVGHDSINPRVRIVFVKDNNTWQAMKTNFDNFDELTNSTKYYPKQVTWNVINNQNYLGTLKSQQYTPKLYRDIGVQEIVGKLPSQFLLPPTKNLQFPLIKMDHKPLVLISASENSEKNFNDPEDWKLSKVTPDETALVLKSIKNTSEKNIKVLESYRSQNHGLILNVLIKNNSKSKNTYLSTIPNWFYISKNSDVKFLGAGMNLIERADLDHDGQTKFIFMYTDPANEDLNSNGYILFDNDFNESARFVWSNH